MNGADGADLHEQPRDAAIDYEDHHNDMGVDDFDPCGTANTNEPFYSQHGGEFIPATLTQNNEMNHDMNNENIDMLMQQRFDGSNLIDAPMQVNVLNIEYAKTSKNIDVRRLKQVIWQLLCESNKNESNHSLEEEKVNNY